VSGAGAMLAIIRTPNLEQPETFSILPTPVAAPVARCHYILFLLTSVTTLETSTSPCIPVCATWLFSTFTFPEMRHIGITKSDYFHFLCITCKDSKLFSFTRCSPRLVASSRYRTSCLLDETKTYSCLKCSTIELPL